MILRRAASLFLHSLHAYGFVVTACSTVQSISILPASGTEILTAVGQTAQYRPRAEPNGQCHPNDSNITTSVAWSTSNPSVATINFSGLPPRSGRAPPDHRQSGGAGCDLRPHRTPGSGRKRFGPTTPSITITPCTGTDPLPAKPPSLKPPAI